MSIRIAIGQFNPCVGDILGNAEIMRLFYARAVKASADILVFPEMSLCGCPLEDLLLQDGFLEDTRAILEDFAAGCVDLTVLVGFAEKKQAGPFSSLAVIANGRVQKVCRKTSLDKDTTTIDINGTSAAITISDDIGSISSRSPQIIINSSASVFYTGSFAGRVQALKQRAVSSNCPIAYCNLVGAQDGLVFDGRSMFIDANGEIVLQAKAFDEDLLVAEVAEGKIITATAHIDHSEEIAIADVYQALVLGTRDYIRKNGFTKALIGISGGIDSALTAVIAADAIGAENVIGVTMPSKFNLPETIADAEKSAANLGVEFHTVPISGVLEQFDKSLSGVSGWDKKTVAYENLQARIRGSILMSLANQFGCVVLATGNKSEAAVGYATLYGDTAGAISVIGDATKTMVYQLSEYVNRNGEIIPADTISRPPSAELRLGQKDTDSLPDYAILDEILKGYIEQGQSRWQLIENGFDGDIVSRVIRMVRLAEYKRRQSPPAIKISPRRLATDRTMPITNRYEPQ